MRSKSQQFHMVTSLDGLYSTYIDVTNALTTTRSQIRIATHISNSSETIDMCLSHMLYTLYTQWKRMIHPSISISCVCLFVHDLLCNECTVHISFFQHKKHEWRRTKKGEKSSCCCISNSMKMRTNAMNFVLF